MGQSDGAAHPNRAHRSGRQWLRARAGACPSRFHVLGAGSAAYSFGVSTSSPEPAPVMRPSPA